LKISAHFPTGGEKVKLIHFFFLNGLGIIDLIKSSLISALFPTGGEKCNLVFGNIFNNILTLIQHQKLSG
jgi:hypothetical protein